jgi:hypothetical protein
MMSGPFQAPSGTVLPLCQVLFGSLLTRYWTWKLVVAFPEALPAVALWRESSVPATSFHAGVLATSSSDLASNCQETRQAPTSVADLDTFPRKM